MKEFVEKLSKEEVINLVNELFVSEKVSMSEIMEVYNNLKHCKDTESYKLLYDGKHDHFSIKQIGCMFNISTKNVRYIFDASNNIPNKKLDIIGRELKLYDRDNMFDGSKDDILLKLYSYLNIFNHLVKVSENVNKGRFYTSKNYLLSKLITNNYLVEWHYERNHETNKYFFGLTFKIKDKYFTFHQPIEYKALNDILPDDKKTDSREFYRDEEADKKYKEEYDNAEFIEQMNMLWKFIVRTSLK